MINAQEWLDQNYPTAEIKAAVKRIGPKQNLTKKARLIVYFPEKIGEKSYYIFSQK